MHRGRPLSDIADQFGTPAYVLDEADFRHRIRRYRAALRRVRIVYAGKAMLTKQVVRWLTEEGVGLDVCSPGELAVGLAGGMDPRSIVVHGNARPPPNCAAATRASGASSSTAARDRLAGQPVAPAADVLVRVTPASTSTATPR